MTKPDGAEARRGSSAQRSHSPENAASEPPGAAEGTEALWSAHAHLAKRLDALEELIGRQGSPGRAGGEQLQEAVADLAACQRDFHHQLAALASTVEQLADGAEPPEETADRPPQRILISPPPARSGGWRAVLRRALKFALRATLGVVRRVWEAASPRPTWADQVDLWLAREPAAALPRLAVILTAEGGPDSAPAALRRQTESDFERIVWDRRTGSYSIADAAGQRRGGGRARGAELARALEADYLWTAPPNLAAVPPTFVETARILLAAEALPFVRYDLSEGGQPLFITTRALWHPEDQLDLKALRALAARAPQKLLGKTVGLGGCHLAPQEPRGPESREVARRAGAYFVAARPQPRIFTHRLASPEPCARSRPDADGRPTVMILLSSQLVGGLEQTLAAMLGALAGEARILLATLCRNEALSAERLRRFCHLTPYVYGLEELFAPELFPAVLGYLIARYEVGHLLHVGAGGRRWHDQIVRLRSRFPELRIVDQTLPARDHLPDPGADVGAGVDLHLPVTAESERKLRQRIPAQRVRRMAPGIGLEPFATGGWSPEKIAELRRELGFVPAATVVTMVSDLIAEKRPEDFAALAHRFRDDERFAFLLVGDGPLAATVGDLGRYFELTNLRLEPPRYALGELLAATDVACTTAESEPFPGVLLAALAMGRPVVAAAVDDLAEILTAGPCGLVVAHPGDVDAFAAAIRDLADPTRRRTLGERGPEVAAERCRPGPVDAYRRALELDGGGAKR